MITRLAKAMLFGASILLLASAESYAVDAQEQKPTAPTPEETRLWDAAQQRKLGELNALLRESEDPLVRLIAHANAESAAAVLALPEATLKADPLLVRIAFEAIENPTPEQTQALKMHAGHTAFGQLALMHKMMAPQEIDSILRSAQFATNWSDGFMEMARRHVAAIKTLAIPPHKMLRDAQMQRAWARGNPAEKALIETSLAHSSAWAVTLGTISLLSMTDACTKTLVDATAQRRTLCDALGRKFEQNAETLITALISVGLQKHATTCADELARLAARKSAWNELLLAFPREPEEADLGDSASLRAMAEHQAFVEAMLANGEVATALSSYAKLESADAKVLTIIRAVRGAKVK